MYEESPATADPAAPDAEHGDRRATIALRAALAMLRPLARWLVRNGVQYTSFAAALKGLFIEAARDELEAAGARLTDSAISVLSGVHRRDIRTGRDGGRDSAFEGAPKTPSVASQVYTRWLTDPAYRDAANQPMALPRGGAAPSFETLAREVSSDVHPRTLLSEMLRLALIESDGDAVRPCAEAFLPRQGLAEDAAMFAANVGDHLAAAVHNLSAGAGRFVERSVFGSGLSLQSVDTLGETARLLWADAFERMAREANPLVEADAGRGEQSMRMRFGVYYYAERVAPGAGQPGDGSGPR